MRKLGGGGGKVLLFKAFYCGFYRIKLLDSVGDMSFHKVSR